MTASLSLTKMNYEEKKKNYFHNNLYRNIYVKEEMTLRRSIKRLHNLIIVFT